MSSSDEDQDALAYLQIINIHNRQRRFWVHPMWQRNLKTGGMYVVMKELNRYPDRFQSFYRMKKDTFFIVLEKLRPHLVKQWTRFREPVSPEERLLVTLRYFASGSSFKSLSYYFLRGHTTICRIVHETSQVIWEKLQPEYMPIPTRETWLEVANRFYNLWNLPHCTGAVDGKHIKIQCPPRSGSEFRNYKGFFSIILQGVVDSDGLFICVDIGELGRNSDGRVLKQSGFGRVLERGNLDLPEPSPLPGEEINFPYYFVGDEAYSLTKNFMKPYARNQLTNERRIFNNRLSRGRKAVECAFGMMASKFELLDRPIKCGVNKIDIIIQAMCVLHNFIRKHDGVKSSPTMHNLFTTRRSPPTRPNTAQQVRNHLTKYFVECAPIPSQYLYCV